MDSAFRIVEVTYGSYVVVPRSDHCYGGVYYRPSGHESIRIAECCWFYPDYRRGHKGIWLKWETGRCFIPCDLFDNAAEMSARLLEAGLKLDVAHKAKLRNLVTSLYGAETAITERDLQWPDEVLHEVAAEGGAE